MPKSHVFCLTETNLDIRRPVIGLVFKIGVPQEGKKVDTIERTRTSITLIMQYHRQPIIVFLIINIFIIIVVVIIF